MKCCVNCFKDNIIRGIIDSTGKSGDCDFCGSKGISSIDVNAENSISDMIIALIGTYSISEDEDAKLLKNALHDDWDIFTSGVETIQNLIINFCKDVYSYDDAIFTKKVLIPQLKDKKFKKKYEIIHSKSWEEFSKSLKFEAGFFNKAFNEKALKKYLPIMQREIPQGVKFYRARISENQTGCSSDDLMIPPEKLRTPGRINPKGIGVLYLSSNTETVLNEIRASARDYVTIGTFISKKKIKVVDISLVASMSPFDGYYDQLDQLANFALNRRTFKDMSYDIAKPLRRNDGALEYLSTQLISEYIKSEGYHGVEFTSTLSKNGKNLAVFDESHFKCLSTEVLEINEVFHSSDKI